MAKSKNNQISTIWLTALLSVLRTAVYFLQARLSEDEIKLSKENGMKSFVQISQQVQNIETEVQKDVKKDS